MKITRIEPIHVSIPFEHGAPRPSEGLGAGGRFDILFVRVETDAGITGWAKPSAMRPFAVGRDATNITGLMGELWFRTKRKRKIAERFQVFLDFGAFRGTLRVRDP